MKYCRNRRNFRVTLDSMLRAYVQLSIDVYSHPNDEFKFYCGLPNGKLSESWDALTMLQFMHHSILNCEDV